MFLWSGGWPESKFESCSLHKCYKYKKMVVLTVQKKFLDGVLLCGVWKRDAPCQDWKLICAHKSTETDRRGCSLPGKARTARDPDCSMCVCVYSLAANGTFRNSAKTGVGALREQILFKCVLKAPRKLSPKQSIGARRTEAWTQRVVRGKIPLNRSSVCVRARAFRWQWASDRKVAI